MAPASIPDRPLWLQASEDFSRPSPRSLAPIPSLRAPAGAPGGLEMRRKGPAWGGGAEGTVFTLPSSPLLPLPMNPSSLPLATQLLPICLLGSPLPLHIWALNSSVVECLPRLHSWPHTQLNLKPVQDAAGEVVPTLLGHSDLVHLDVGLRRKREGPTVPFLPCGGDIRALQGSGPRM